MRARLALALAAALLLPQSVPPAAQVDSRFHSAALDREMPYRVLLPAGYGATQRRYPVLYLLHGLDGHYTDWTLRTSLAAHAARTDIIIVMPEGANSWYVNWHDGDDERWEDYLSRDLIEEVDARFATEARRESRVIAGLSMGGYGAIRMALKHPRLFKAAASLSGAFNVTRLETFGWTDGLRAEFARAFGPRGSARRNADDVFALAEAASPEALPYIYFACGTGDSFLAPNRELAAILTRRGIAHTYRESDGGHTWTFWDSQIAAVLALTR
jgi:S-formylglutathione hydrolase FrmB